MDQLNAIFFRLREIEQHTASSVVLEEGRTLMRLFLKRVPIIVEELFPLLAIKFSSAGFASEWIRIYQLKVTREKNGILNDVEQCRRNNADDRFFTAQLPRIARREKISSVEDFRNFLYEPGIDGTLEILSNEYRYLNSDEDGGYISTYYFQLELAELLYDRYVEAVSLLERFERKILPILKADYSEIGIALAETDQQFAKYGLITLDENFRISNTKERQSIVDCRIEKHYTLDVPGQLLAAIELARNQALLGRLSFNVDGISSRSIALEGVEYGAIFDFDALKLPDMTRIYDEAAYENSLWIKVDKAKNSMTFEELVDDFGELNNQVITQVLHLEFFQENDKYYISHLDHEYILYSLLEYADRQRNGNVKGHDKLKTFKVDNARLPLNWSFDGKFFLFIALNAYFRNKELIQEYFGKVQS